MDDRAFGRAFQTFDAAIWAHSAGSALINDLGGVGNLDSTRKTQNHQQAGILVSRTIGASRTQKKSAFWSSKIAIRSTRRFCSCVSHARSGATPVEFRHWSTVVRVVYRQTSIAEDRRASRIVAPREIACRCGDELPPPQSLKRRNTGFLKWCDNAKPRDPQYSDSRWSRSDLRPGVQVVGAPVSARVEPRGRLRNFRS